MSGGVKFILVPLDRVTDFAVQSPVGKLTIKSSQYLN